MRRDVARIHREDVREPFPVFQPPTFRDVHASVFDVRARIEFRSFARSRFLGYLRPMPEIRSIGLERLLSKQFSRDGEQGTGRNESRDGARTCAE